MDRSEGAASPVDQFKEHHRIKKAWAKQYPNEPDAVGHFVQRD
jgi:hypothetical protein